MAERPVFVPRSEGQQLLDEVPIHFEWSHGMAPSQKRKNIAALHRAAESVGLTPLLEISSKSPSEHGIQLSAFALLISLDGIRIPVENAFQGSKVFQYGGPFRELYWASSRDAKRDQRLKESGHLIRFEFEHTYYPLDPPTAFYDWLYINALCQKPDLSDRLEAFGGFTDIEFNPSRSLNCQARSCATFVALRRRGILDEALESFQAFTRVLQQGSV